MTTTVQERRVTAAIDKAESEFPLAPPVVAGLAVRPQVHNLGSIDASYTDYHVLRGIRLVDWPPEPAQRVFAAADDIDASVRLAQAIAESRQITPLIVGVECGELYILEGAHRLAALGELGIGQFPAVVVVDLSWEKTCSSFPGRPGPWVWIETEGEPAGEIKTNPAWEDILDPEEAPDILDEFLGGDLELTQNEAEELFTALKLQPERLQLADAVNRWTVDVNRKRYVIENDGGVLTAATANKWLDLVMWEPEKYVNVDDLSNFWESPSTLYHATDPENIESILQHGLWPESQTRGITNRGVGSAVFTSLNPDVLDAYGSALFAIDTQGMKRDGYMPEVGLEPDVVDYEAKTALVSALGLEEQYSVDVEQGMDPDTVIVYGSIPPKYLGLVAEENPMGSAGI